MRSGRRIIISAYIVILICCSIVFGDSGLSAKVNRIISGMPAKNTAEENKLFAEIIKLGPNAVKEICSKLNQPGEGDDSKARYALGGLTNYVNCGNAEEQRKMYVAVLCEQLRREKDSEVKSFLISQLQFAGKAESINVLGDFLTDERLAEPAGRALLTIGTGASQEAFLRALPLVEGKRLITVINALGGMQSKRALKEILTYAKSDDADIRLAALYAIANIGDKSAGRVLEEASKSMSGYEGAKATSFYLLYAKRLGQQGDKRSCAKVCRSLIKNSKSRSNVKCAALGILVDIVGKEALNDLLAAADSEDNQLVAAVLKFSHSLEGSKVTKSWTKKIKKASLPTQMKIVEMLGQRGDKTAALTIEKLLLRKDTDRQVRIAAVSVVVKLQEKEAVPVLLDFLEKTNEKGEIEAVKEALMYVKGADIVLEAAKALPKLTPNSKVAVMEILARRKVVEHLDLVFENTKGEEQQVRIASIKALGDLADEKQAKRVVDVLLGAESAQERSAAQKVTVAVLGKMDDLEERAGLILTAFDSADKEQKISILKVLSKICGPKVLQVVVKQVQSDDVEIKDAAIRALADWQRPEAIDELLEIIESEEELKYRVIALRGCVQLIGQSDWDSVQRIETYMKALQTVERIEDKRLLLAALSKERSVRTVKLLAENLDNEKLKEEIALAIAKIACPQGKKDKGLSGYDVESALKKAVGIITDDKIKEQVRVHLKKITTVPAGFISLFNGKDLTGWERHKNLPGHGVAGKWFVEDGAIVGVQDPPGKGGFLTTRRKYRDLELILETKIDWPFDSGVFLRTGPAGKSHQVTLDYRDGGEIGKIYMPWGKGSVHHCPEGIKYFRKGLWNKIRIICEGEPAWIGVWVNDSLVTSFQHTKKTTAGFPEAGGISLQVHPGGKGYEDSKARFRNIYIRKILRDRNMLSEKEKVEGYVLLFNGKDLSGWKAFSRGGEYVVQEGKLIFDHTINVNENGRSVTDLYTEKRYSDFILRFGFKLTEGANNGIGVRVPMEGHAAYDGFEVQILDDSAEKWKNLKDYQYHGSVYGVVPAK
ncbi:MAG: family 16 glycoside hydrolase, partial [Planctomycetota bacterium]